MQKDSQMIWKNRSCKRHKQMMHVTLPSFLCNLLLGLGKLCIGMFYSSYWLMMMGSYYIVLCLAKGYILHTYAHIQNKTSSQAIFKLQKVYHRAGIFMVLLAISYFFSCYEMMVFEQTIAYPSYLLYGVVAYAFYKISMAVAGLLQARKHHDPLFLVLKVLTFSDGCVGIVSAQCALLTMQNSAYASSSSAYLGIGVSIGFLIIGCWMMKKYKSPYLENQPDKDFV